MKMWDWLTSWRSKPDSVPKKPSMEDIFTAFIRDRFAIYPSKNLTPQKLDQILRQADIGWMREVAELFEEFEEKDPHIFSCFQTRKQAVLGLQWYIKPASEDPEDVKIAKFVEDVLKNIPDFRNALLDLLDAIAKGYAVREIVWGTDDDGKIVIDQLRFIHNKNVTWLNSLVPRILTEENQSIGVEPPPWKVIMHLYKAKSGHDTRNGVMRVVAWMYLFKNYAIKDWVVFNEVFGMPIRVGKYDPGSSPDDISKLARAVQNMGSDAAGVISKNTEIEFVESVRGTGRMNPYQMLTDFVNREISKAVLGQTLTSDATGQTGTYSTAKIHELVRQDIIEADAVALGQTLTLQLIRPLVGFNFPQGWKRKVPTFWIKAEAEEDLKALSETYVNLSKIQFPIPISHISEVFGIPLPKDGEAVTGIPAQGREVLPPGEDVHQTPGEPAVGPVDNPPAISVDNKTLKNLLILLKSGSDSLAQFHARGIQEQIALNNLVDAALKKNGEVTARLLEPVKKLIDSGRPLEEIQGELFKVYPKMPKKELAELLTQAMMLAYMRGRLNGSDTGDQTD